jgi:hypothetical protein
MSSMVWRDLPGKRILVICNKDYNCKGFAVTANPHKFFIKNADFQNTLAKSSTWRDNKREL